MSHDPYVTVEGDRNIRLSVPTRRFWHVKDIQAQDERKMSSKKSSDSVDDLAESIGRVRPAWDEAEYLRCEAERAEEGSCSEICWLVISYLMPFFFSFITDVAVLVEHLDQGDQLFRGRRIVVMPHQLVRVRPWQLKSELRVTICCVHARCRHRMAWNFLHSFLFFLFVRFALTLIY
jgi:hypothetical protein